MEIIDVYVIFYNYQLKLISEAENRLNDLEFLMNKQGPVNSELRSVEVTRLNSLVRPKVLMHWSTTLKNRNWLEISFIKYRIVFFPKFLQRDKKVVMKNREVRKIVGLENRASTEANKFIGQSHVLTNPYYNYIFCSFDSSLKSFTFMKSRVFNL